MHSMPRQKHLSGVLRGRKSGAMKDRRIPRGGAHNTQRELMEEAEMHDIVCEYCDAYIYDMSKAIYFNDGVAEFYAHQGECARRIVNQHGGITSKEAWVSASDCIQRAK